MSFSFEQVSGFSVTPHEVAKAIPIEQFRSHRLYGRENSTKQLLELFESVCRGQSETLLLPGPSGVGKTAFARVLAEPVASSNGFFLEGKFDQFGRSKPFTVFCQVLLKFCNFSGHGL